jgi:dTDP-4-dehydrorhamnose reductase
MAMRVLIAGGAGQLARELLAAAPPGWQAVAAGRERLDIADFRQVAALVAEIEPQLIINAAAYTAVDKAESETDAAFAVNALGAANLARAASGIGGRMIQVSTDFVFNGASSMPYQPDDSVEPLGVYGASKLEGEKQVQAILGGKSLILRTAWVYSRYGHNFVLTMLRLLSERQQIRVVADQVGTPTWARGLAETIWRLAATELEGIFHWTDAGVASWYDFAVAISEEAQSLGIIPRPAAVLPIGTEEYPTAARRPAYSVLDKSSLWKALGQSAPHWRQQLRRMLAELTTAGSDCT